MASCNNEELNNKKNVPSPSSPNNENTSEPVDFSSPPRPSELVDFSSPPHPSEVQSQEISRNEGEDETWRRLELSEQFKNEISDQMLNNKKNVPSPSSPDNDNTSEAVDASSPPPHASEVQSQEISRNKGEDETCRILELSEQFKNEISDQVLNNKKNVPSPSSPDNENTSVSVDTSSPPHASEVQSQEISRNEGEDETLRRLELSEQFKNEISDQVLNNKKNVPSPSSRDNENTSESVDFSSPPHASEVQSQEISRNEGEDETWRRLELSEQFNNEISENLALDHLNSGSRKKSRIAETSEASEKADLALPDSVSPEMEVGLPDLIGDLLEKSEQALNELRSLPSAYEAVKNILVKSEFPESNQK